MNSCLYECRVMHNRLEPIRNAFHYDYFMFYVDIDELDRLPKRHALISHNRPNAYTFRDKDHLHRRGSVRDSVLEFCKSNGLLEEPARIMLLTNFQTFGYTFNPVSFYFCFDAGGRALCAVVEVHNTFGEMKPYFVPRDSLLSGEFRHRTDKFFYVSPFIDMDTLFEFRLAVPADRLHLQIDDYRHGKRLFLSTLTGRRRDLTSLRLAWWSLRFPLVTVKIILMIHWQALKLWLRRLPYYRKHENTHLQKEIYHRKGP